MTKSFLAKLITYPQYTSLNQIAKDCDCDCSRGLFSRRYPPSYQRLP